ncbi:MAG: DUF3426 domain-containing protein [Pseudomonadales bacterium]|nr:DUF3426 domain-containing protein [Pseudomonadales bacterium]
MPTEDEDLAPLITCCPKCDTRFRVTEAQLQVAKGQVRCGSCLHVFDGTAHLLVDGEVLTGSASTDVDALLDEIDLADELDTSAGGDVTGTSDDPDPDSENNSIVSEDFGALIPLNDLAAPIDSHLAAEMSSTSNSAGSAATPDDDLSTHDPEADARLKALEDELMADLKGVLSTSPVPSDAAALDKTIPSEKDQTQTAALSTASDNAGRDETEFEITATPNDLGWEQEPSEQIELKSVEPESPEQLSPEEDGPEEDSPTLQEIPAELLVDERPKRGVGTWVVLAIALIALPAQVLWFQFDTWVKDESIRPVYAFICDVAGCELPLRRDVGLIVAKNSVLRDHPDQAEALIYDALLVNHAPYPQPFPFVELTLTTIGGHLVASRRFKPGEYLGGEAASAKMMQPRTPIHVSLELKDPGQAPLNFQIRFLPAG